MQRKGKPSPMFNPKSVFTISPLPGTTPADDKRATARTTTRTETIKTRHHKFRYPKHVTLTKRNTYYTTLVVQYSITVCVTVILYCRE